MLSSDEDKILELRMARDRFLEAIFALDDAISTIGLLEDSDGLPVERWLQELVAMNTELNDKFVPLDQAYDEEINA